MRNILVVAFIFQALGFSALAGVDKQSLEKVTNESIEHYNNQKYDESLLLLESIKSSRNQYINWYYYYGLNQARLNRYDEAIESLQTYIKGSNATDTAKAYYNLGLIQFYQREYGKALTSLELSMDVSTDSKQDMLTEALIDRVIRYQNYFENNKKTNLSFLLGYTFDTNVVNLSPDSFTDNLNGHVLGYGASISHKVVDRYNFIFEPSFAILDNYTLDSKFKSNSVLQSTDALQFLLSAPIRFYFEEEALSNKFDFSLNAYSVYLPINSTTRELSLTSFYVKGQVFSPISNDYAVKYNVTLSVDKSFGYTSDSDDASGLRFDFLGTFVKYTSQADSRNIFYDLGADYSSTKGINTRYKRYTTAIGYSWPSWMSTFSSVRLAYQYMNYADKASPRTDNQATLSYNISKEVADRSTLGFVAGYTNNSSNTDLNKYSDFTAGIQYTKSFGF
ncbi:tetratricopeptide repeat protein [bacterium]|nr:tetratricopeptide repeat protein [bacterium]